MDSYSPFHEDKLHGNYRKNHRWVSDSKCIQGMVLSILTGQHARSYTKYCWITGEANLVFAPPPFMQTAHYAECISVVSDTKLSVLFVFMRFKGRLI